MVSKNIQETKARPNIVVICIGNEYRSDDGIGIFIADLLAKFNLNGTKILKQNGEPTLLIDSWGEAEKAILIDATSSGVFPGTVTRYNVTENPLPSHLFHYSTHSFGLAEVIELARRLNKLPASLIVYGVEGKNFENGLGISSEVEKGIDDTVELIVEEILVSKTERK